MTPIKRLSALSFRGTVAFAALCGFSLSAALLYPGELTSDSTQQYAEAVSGQFTDWHPPVMAFVWRQLLPVIGGPAAMLLFHLALLWTGLGIVADRLVRDGFRRSALLVLAGGLNPFLLFYGGQILKDVSLATALFAAFALAFPAERRIDWPSRIIISFLIVYALLVRANAAIALAPILLFAFRSQWRLRWRSQAAFAFAFSVVAIPCSWLASRALFQAERTGVEQTLILHDLAGIAARTGDTGDLPPIIGAPTCYTPLFWDSLKFDRCEQVFGELRARETDLRSRWASAILRHPLAYGQHRLEHFNLELFFLVPPMQQCVIAPSEHDCPQQLTARPLLMDLVKKNALLWPVTWMALAIALLWHIRRHLTEHDAAAALLLSGLLYGFGFALFGVAANFRYFYWPVLAIQTAAILIVRRSWSWRILILPAAVVALGYVMRAAYLISYSG